MLTWDLSENNSNGCSDTKATLPCVVQAKATIPATVGAATIYSGVPGTAACVAGEIKNKGCAALRLVINYIVGSDCDSCTVDTFSVSPITLLVTPDTAIKLPSGYVASILAETGSIDAAGAFVASPATSEQVVSYYATGSGCCSGGGVLIP